VARCFVSRRLPGTALERLCAEHDLDVWPGEMPPNPEELRERTQGAEALLSMLADTLDEPLEKALAAPDGLRLCVLLVDVEGLEYAEAATTLGVPIGTVRSRLSRARFQLHDMLQQYGRDRRLL